MNKEITVKSEKIFEGKIINLRVDTVELQNQKYAKREIVEHKGASAIIALNENDELILVKQYRKAVEEFLYEIPAGKINVAEEPRECALRELKEETGYEAKDIAKIYEIYSTPGFSNEKIYLFKAEDLTYTATNFDEDENIEVITISKSEAKKMLETGQITDSKTIVGILFWLNM
ncbi:ADP-ribose pyrophosphatase [Sedimentibacter acidaminivorans]|uniref:ADP-ribose pyrophosphatase n=1 Tax=Sedimentibacter acidaminivorans TaxID=913099 RepID=A0ABS4GCK6_9FIRM|nr:NUDIX hydrolase [Sedimentibacter acidaminivorans]MBP1925414.1 ADP-ribose pyrophosphatase [Sedimentibacter acidaminivorans]